MRAQKIRTTPDRVHDSDFELSGWLSGETSYLWFGRKDWGCMASLGGQKLYRLAKAIVRQFEEAARERAKG